MEKRDQGFATRSIHAGSLEDPYNALTAPIYQTATFSFDNCAQGGARFAGQEGGFIYTRLGNPTTTMLEQRIASLEGAEAAVAFSSGMGAISSVLWTLCKSGAHIVANSVLYGCTFAYLEHGMSKYGVEVTFSDLTVPGNLEKALKDNTAVVYLESPTNPDLGIIDIRETAAKAHSFNKDIRVVCDNTFATPYLQLPLELGCDVVVHSATKYLNGHGDVIAGFAAGRADLMTAVRFEGQKDMTGSVLGPFEAFLILRGLKTLEIRMERHCDSAEKIVEFLKGHEKVEKIYYPGLPEHPNHAVAMKQMRRPGGMVAFEVRGGREAGVRLLDSLKLCTLAVSLGDAETLVEHPASMTHSTYSPEELERAGVSAGLVRMSVGLENIEDIIADLEQGLAAL